MPSPRIAYVTDQRLPNTVATSEQILNMAAALATQGARLDLLVPHPRPLPDPSTLRATLAAYYGVRPSFELVCLPEWTWAPRPIGKTRHALLATRQLRTRPGDLLYTRTVLAAVLGIVAGRQVVLETYHVLDRQRPATARVVSWLTRRDNLIGVVAHSGLARDGLIRAGAIDDRIAVFRNGFNPQRLAPVLSKNEARDRLGWNRSDRIVCYTGRVDVDKGARAILTLAAQTPDVTYVAVGDTERDPTDWLLQEAAAAGCRNVRWFPAVPPSELGPYLYAADVLLIPPTAAPLDAYGRTVLPLKTYFYMAAGRPILAPALPDIAEVLSTENAALVPPDDPAAAADAVRRLLAQPEVAGSLAQVAQEAVAGLTWERRAADILAWIADRRA